MKPKNLYNKYLLISFLIIEIIIAVYVLFSYPQPGVADQGDFRRIMIVSGLENREADTANPEFKRFYNYIVTDYNISKVPGTELKNANITNSKLKNLYDKIVSTNGIYNGWLLRILAIFVTTSMTCYINFIVLICSLFGISIFKTGYLAVLYSIIYILSIFFALKYINIKSKVSYIIFGILSLFVLFDGNYLVWFNSLYGEPMMITSLVLFISAWLYYLYCKNVLKSKDNIAKRIIIIYASAFMFLGSKMQVISALPIIILMFLRLLYENKDLIHHKVFVKLCIVGFLVILYPIVINITISTIGDISYLSKDTQYNSVFYGILIDSKNPRQDLIDMGLNPDMIVEAGKHSYLDKKKYVKYIPHSEITEKEFYSKMSNMKLIKFYLTHPLRFIHGMEYTASHAFITSTTMGKYKIELSKKPISKFNRFTEWSYIKDSYLPKKLIFIVIVYAAIGIVSLLTYFKEKNENAKDKILLLWAIMFIGILQFAMPYVGNGHADTSKQLYLFNFIFDLMIIVSVSWCVDKVNYLKNLALYNK